MRSFLPALRMLDEKLGVPVPARVRILRELEYDLEALRKELETQGLAPDEARSRALEALVPDDTALEELGHLHTPRYRRWTRHLSAARLRILERSALVGMTLVVLLVETAVLLETDLPAPASPFMWPVLGLGAVSFAAVVAEAFALWTKGDHHTMAIGTRVVLGLAAMTMATGVLGVLTDGYALLDAPERVLAIASFRPDPWIAREAALLAVSMVLSLSGAVAWYVLTSWRAWLTGARHEVLGFTRTTVDQEV